MINDKMIKEKISKAKELVKGVNEPFKIAAFEVILAKLLENVETTIINKENRLHSPSIPTPSPKQEPQETWKDELANKCNITVDQINDFIILKDDETAELLIKFDSTLSEKEKQTQGSQCIILALTYATGNDWIGASELIKSIEHSAISSSHISRTLDENNKIFRPAGMSKGRKYKLSGPGRAETFELIKKLVNKNQ